MAVRKFIIWTTRFDDRSGGVIALHLLAARLREHGFDASLWPADRPVYRFAANPRRYAGWLRYLILRRDREFSTGPFPTPLARRADLRDAIIIYPEVLGGNPLGARNVVRWLLHKPGFHTGKAEFGARDLFFHYQDHFAPASLPSSRLTLSWLNETYRDIRGVERSGSTYLLRKGRGRELKHDLTQSVCVDDMTHEERAAAFNRSLKFYSYDLYTMYSRYAAICGCVPIIVPDPAVTKEQWVPHEKDRYGLAYGEGEANWAIATRGKLLANLVAERQEEDAMLQAFVKRCEERFA